MPPEQPSGPVTLVFSDIEGSTKLLHELGTDAYREALAEHRTIVREAYARYSGYEVDYEGDAFFYAFASAPEAVAAVSEAMAGLQGGPIRIRVGVHTGEPALDPPKYVGMDVHFAARVMSSAHGGQVVCSSATAELVEVELTSLGSHRLKDISEPVSLYQLGEGTFPPLKTIANTNLPTPASSFLGRERELYEADERLQQTRLLTVHGPGGQGKTRFALELATRAREERFSDYPDGVFACFLASLRDPALVLPTIAQTLSVREQPRQTALDALAAHLEGRKLLLLLDNLEHLLDCAPELSHLLQRSSGLTLLCTSRELLRIQGEAAYALPALPEHEGIALFCERSKLEPTPTIAEIALRLEGLPLALELAAARLAILTPQQLLERLSQRLDLLRGTRDADPRQQTLRATIEWSYELLSADEKRLFARLSVFQGGCTLEAAEEVCGADLDSLQSLVDKSLLRFTEERFWMLETIREYAGERLEAEGDAEGLQDGHLVYLRELAERGARKLKGEDQLAELALLTSEQENIRAALDHGCRGSATRLQAARLAAALVEFWDIRAQYTEARARYGALLEYGVELPETVLADVLSGAAQAAHRQGDQAEALELTRDAIGLFERAGAFTGLTRALGSCAFIHLWRGEIDLAAASAERAVAMSAKTDDEWVTACALAALASVRGEQGDNVTELSLLGEAQELFAKVGDHRNQAIMRLNLGSAALALGGHERALELFADAQAGARAVDDLGTVANALTERGELALALARLDDAAAAFDEGLEIGSTLGMGQVVSRCRAGQAEIRQRRAQGSAPSNERKVTGDE